MTGVGEWIDDGKELPKSGAKDSTALMEAKLSELGAQGWELVCVIPYSFDQGTEAKGTVDEQLGGGLSVSLYGYSGNGFSTNDIWVFKRPK